MKSFLLFTTVLFLNLSAKAQDAIERIWFNAEKSAKIQIFKAKDQKFYGKIIWLKEPNRNGKPKLDDNNPNEQLAKQPLMGLAVLKGFEKTEKDVYENGTIYDPKNGKTYCCTIKHKGKQLDVRGYIGISLIGRTTEWTLAE